jgi:phage terminase small subunit
MSSEPITLHRRRRPAQSAITLSVAEAKPGPAAESDTSPPDFLVDDIAREEWTRVAAIVPSEGARSLMQRTLLAGYCNAVARAVRAERILAAEGHYYHSTTGGGAVIRRRHPAVQDAEQGWTSARHLAKQLGIIGGSAFAQQSPAPRRNLFK